MAVATKEQRIRRERTKLRRLLRCVDADRLKAVDKLIDRCAFLSVTMEDLEDHINEHGCVSEYQNGENQWGTKKSPEAEVYASLMQRYLPAMKQLVDLLPEPPKIPAGAALPPWVAGGSGGGA